MKIPAGHQEIVDHATKAKKKANKPKPPPKWEKSPAKELLTQEILADIVKAHMKPKAVWLTHDEYKAYPLDRFGNNLRNLREQILKLKGRSEFDAVSVAHDLALHPPVPNHPRGYPRWEGSEAQKQLKKDVDEQKHLVYKPKVLRETFDEYKKFPLDVFRDHIYQAEGKLVESSYWLSRKKNKQDKK
jgi:hypothetical protein